MTLKKSSGIVLIALSSNKLTTMYKKTLLSITILCLLLNICSIQATTSAQKLHTAIEDILDKHDSNAHIGIIIQSLNTDEILYQKNAHQLFVPASVLKTFTAAAALSFLGPTYHFQTKILTENSTVTNGALHSNIYFRFDGDPTLTQENIAELIAKLSERGIQSIKGNIYIDDSVFDQEVYGPGWMWDELDFCYAAPTSAIIINKNCFPIKFSTKTKRSKPKASVDNNYKNLIFVRNQVFTKPSPKSNCTFDLHTTNNNEYLFTGCIDPNKPMKFDVAIHNIRLYTKKIINEKLQSHKIKLHGNIYFKPIPTKRTLATMAQHNSNTLTELLKDMLKNSDNMIADAIHKKIGNIFFHKTSTWSESAQAIAKIMTSKTKIDFKKMQMADGSGLSRYNLTTPLQVLMLLRYAYFNKDIQEQFISALAQPKEEGTLKLRMPNLKDQLYAKTGSMSDISSLAGYIYTNSKDTLAFIIVINSFIDGQQKYQTLQDEICTVLANS